MTHRRRRPGGRGAGVGRGRLFQPQGLPAYRHGIGSEPAVEKLVLLILHDEETASTGVVEKAPVVLHQGGVGLIRSGTDDDRAVAIEVPPLQRRGVEQSHRHPHVAQRLGHLIGRAADVAQPGEPGQSQRCGTERGPCRLGVGARPDVRVVDHIHADIVRGAGGILGHRPDLQAVRHQAGGRLHLEHKRRPLVLPGEPEPLRGHGRPAARKTEADRSNRRVLGTVSHGDREPVRDGRGQGPDLGGWIQLDVEPGDDGHGTAHLAPRLIVEPIHGFGGPRGSQAVGFAGIHFHRPDEGRWLERLTIR